jgi:hypothetical protein
MAKRVYFAFHYQDVIDFRANVVRNHNAIQGVENAGYYDASIWEENKKQGDLALKRMINKELDYTSVTVVLIGSQTYSRRWVQYEIMKSIERGNVLFGIHINNIPDKNKQVKIAGPNPFDFLGLMISEDGKKGSPTIWDGTKWIYYKDLDPFAVPEQPYNLRNKNSNLSTWFTTKDWITDDGYNNFERWVK